MSIQDVLKERDTCPVRNLNKTLYGSSAGSKI